MKGNKTGRIQESGSQRARPKKENQKEDWYDECVLALESLTTQDRAVKHYRRHRSPPRGRRENDREVPVSDLSTNLHCKPNHQITPTIYQTVTIEGMEVRAKIDPNSVCTILKDLPKGAQLGEKMEIPLDNGNDCVSGRTFQGKLCINGRLTGGLIIYAPSYPENVIGVKQLCDLEMITVKMMTRTVNVTPVVIKGSDPPRARQPYLKRDLMEQANLVIKRWESQGIIERANSPCNSPIKLVRKPNKKVKILFNFHMLNQCSEAIPGTEINRKKAISGIKLGSYYSFIQLHYGEWHIPLDKSTKYKTAFTFRGQQYVWNRLPQGFKNTTVILHKTLGQILEKLPQEIKKRLTYYVDVILISGNTKTECHNFTTEVRCHLEDNGFEINRANFKVCKSTVEFLGREVHPEGIKLGRNYLQRVQNVKSPQNVKELQKILGLLNDAVKHTPRYRVLCKSLNKLLRKNCPWIWSNEEETVLNTLICQILKNRMAVPGLNDGEKCTVQIFVDDEDWMAEILNSEKKPYQSEGGIFTPYERKQNIEIRELKAMKRVWDKNKDILEDREVEWHVVSPLVTRYQNNSEHQERNIKGNFSFMYRPEHKVIVIPAAIHKPPL
ncbi:uncharacterized protein WCC33_007219 [Rhinophrynus dorsalis]